MRAHLSEWHTGCSWRVSRHSRRHRGYVMRLIGDFIFFVLFVLFLLAWLVAWAAFHVVGGGVHLLLVVAVIWLLIHIFRRRTA